jgi:hypothetical protein
MWIDHERRGDGKKSKNSLYKALCQAGACLLRTQQEFGHLVNPNSKTVPPEY